MTPILINNGLFKVELKPRNEESGDMHVIVHLLIKSFSAHYIDEVIKLLNRTKDEIKNYPIGDTGYGKSFPEDLYAHYVKESNEKPTATEG